jgi:lipopolysaccharide export system permease protein
VRDQLTRDTKDLGGSEFRDLEARYDGQTDILIGGEKTVAVEKRIVKPTFVLPNTLSKYGKQLVAESAYHLDATADHPAGYLLKKVSVPTNIDKLKSLRQGDRVIIVTRKEAPWLNPKEAFVVSQVHFQLLANGSSWRRFASIHELVEELNQPSTEPGADLRVAVHSRILQPFMDATMLMLGLPLMFSRRHRNIFLSIGICLLAGIAFSVVAPRGSCLKAWGWKWSVQADWGVGGGLWGVQHRDCRRSQLVFRRGIGATHPGPCTAAPSRVWFGRGSWAAGPV